jgi:lysophospholipase L1-like esterase
MYRLAEAVVTRDFSAQENADFVGCKMPEYFGRSLERLKSIDFNAVDVVTIAHGINDLAAGQRADDPEDPYNVDTLAGALRCSIERLLTAYPHLQIYPCSMMWYTWTHDGSQADGDTKQFSGVSMKDYVEAVRRVAREYHLPFINLYDELGLNRLNRPVYFQEGEGIHHNAKGAELIARKIAKELF